jgi:hypothetical protein
MMFGGGLALAAGIGESGLPTGSASRSSRFAPSIRWSSSASLVASSS